MFRMSKRHVELRFVFYTHMYIYLKCHVCIPGTQMGPLVLNGVWAFFWMVSKKKSQLGSRYANVLDESF